MSLPFIGTTDLQTNGSGFLRMVTGMSKKKVLVSEGPQFLTKEEYAEVLRLSVGQRAMIAAKLANLRDDVKRIITLAKAEKTVKELQSW